MKDIKKNILLIALLISAMYLCTIQTLLYLRMPKSQYLIYNNEFEYDSEDFKYYHPMKFDAETGDIYELKKQKNGRYKWIKAKIYK
jgi:hypothetical protein